MKKGIMGVIVASIIVIVGLGSCSSASGVKQGENLALGTVNYFLEQVESLEQAVSQMSAKNAGLFDNENVTIQIEAFKTKVKNAGSVSGSLLKDFEALQKSLLLLNPEIAFDDVLCRKTKNASMPANWVGNSEISKFGYGNQIISFSIKGKDKDSTLIDSGAKGDFLGDVVLHYDAGKFLYSSISDNENWEVFEYDLNSGESRQVSQKEFEDVDNYNGVYLPDGKIIFCSTACMAGVPCVNGDNDVANLYVMENDGSGVRQLTYEQDADWYPYVMNSGKVMYLRWEYTDNSHYFTRVLMSMNPDGTEQKGLYGSSSYWPNTMFYAKQIPGNDNQFAAIVSGHHGTARAGELVLFDTSLGYREAEGAVMRLGAVNKKVRTIVKDRLVENIWPKYLHPYPLSETTFLVASQTDANTKWAIYLVDTFGNRVKIKDAAGYHLMEPVPVLKRVTPPSLADRIDVTKKEAIVYLQDIYNGDGLKGIPRGTVKELRISTYGYTLRNYGNHDKLGVESAWDGKIILGTVDVEEDGSAMFKMPANLPISIQPLDKDGAALQLMRSWTTAMPGEYVSCLGCHEGPDQVPKYEKTIASRKEPSELKPVFDQPAGIGYETEIQPILDQYCISCHDGSGSKPDFKDKRKVGIPGFSKSYHNFHPYVRRPGPESDFYMLRPMEYHVSTSELVQILDKGHNNVTLDPLSKRKLYRWIDLNAPYYPNYRQFFKSDDYNRLEDKAKKIRVAYNTYVVDTGVDPRTVNRVETAESVSTYKDAVNRYNNEELLQIIRDEHADSTVSLKVEESGNSLSISAGTAVMNLVKIKSGKVVTKSGSTYGLKKDLFVADTEVTNKFYSLFNPDHDSRYYDQQWKDHIGPGYAANKPQQPVIRISKNEAVVFCEWLSKMTGKKVRLLNEQEWGYAALAGSNGPFSFGRLKSNFGLYENLADRTLVKLAVTGVDPQPTAPTLYNNFVPRSKGWSDGNLIAANVASLAKNRYGLYDMHGNVSEWIESNEADLAIAKGGSWRDRPYRATVDHRFNYKPFQPVFGVGFRFCIEE